MSFSGFSEDDIRKISKGQDINKTQKASHKTALKKVTFKPNHNNTNYGSRSKTYINNVSKSLIEEVPDNTKLNVQDVDRMPLEAVNNNKQEEKVIAEEPRQQSPKQEKKFKDLDEFEARQKLIEEQNRKRKELLAKALADRTKQTQEEAQRLNEIQEEFKKLDAMLSGDVKILRKKIELASIEYMECQKKYFKIEKDYLDAKLLLHQKQEKKEMLTEHLCAIIEKNEERKAEKLNELLQKLQLKPPENELNENSVIRENGTENPK